MTRPRRDRRSNRPRRPRDILVVDLLGGFGDLLLALPMVHALARCHPDAAIRVLTHEPGAALLRGDPAVCAVRTPRHPRPGAERQAVIRELARPPDLAVSTTRYDGIPALLDAAAGRAVTDLWRDPPASELVDRRYLRILYSEGLIGRAELDTPARIRLHPRELAAGTTRVSAALAGAGPVPPVVLAAGSGMAVKRWPAGHWTELASRLRAAGVPVLALADGGAPAGVPVLPRGDLRATAADLAAVGARGGVVVGGDTGPVRLAAAVGAAVVALFGPTVAGRYGFATGRATHLQGEPDCPYRRPTAITEQTCWWQARCPLDPAGPACLSRLPVDAVYRAVGRLRAGASR